MHTQRGPHHHENPADRCLYTFTPLMDHWLHQSLMSSQQNKETSSAVNVMSSSVVLRGRGQECHSQPSCSAAVPGSTQIHPRQQQKKKKHKRLMFKSFLEATDPFQRSLSILSPSGDFSQIPVFCFFLLISSQPRERQTHRRPGTPTEVLVLEILQ